MNRNLLIAAFALAPLVASASMTYNQGDLLVAFRALGGKGITQDYVINVGPVATLRDATTAPASPIGHLGTDFALTFGNDWFTRTDLQWSAACTPSQNAAVGIDDRWTSYVSQPEDSPGVPGSALSVDGSSAFHTLSNKLAGIQLEFKNNGTPSANPAATFQVTSSQSSWNAFMAPSGTLNYTADLTFFNEIEALPSKTLSLFRISTDTTGSGSETGTYEGYLTLSSSGDITFTPAPPSTGNQNTYTSWATTNVGGQGPTQDFDGDGVTNGLEYFMGSTTGPTAHAVPLAGVVTWPRSATAVVTAFRVETSTDLVTWTTADPSTVNAAADHITFTPAPGAPKTFVRLAVDLP